MFECTRFVGVRWRTLFEIVQHKISPKAIQCRQHNQVICSPHSRSGYDPDRCQNSIFSSTDLLTQKILSKLVNTILPRDAMRKRRTIAGVRPSVCHTGVLYPNG